MGECKCGVILDDDETELDLDMCFACLARDQGPQDFTPPLPEQAFAAMYSPAVRQFGASRFRGV